MRNNKSKGLFNILFPNIESYLLFVSKNLTYLNLNNLTISNKLVQIYHELFKLNNATCNQKLKELIRSKFNFQYKNRLQLGFWLERGHQNPGKIVGIIQSTNSNKVKNRFTPTSENLLKFGYDKETVRSWRGGPNFQKYWIKRGYSEKESKIKVSEFQIKSNSFVNYENRISDTNIQYYIDRGFSHVDSKEMLSKRQDTINLDRYIRKYGHEVGQIKYKEMCSNRSNYLGCSKKGYSEISQELFNILTSKYKSNNIFYATKSKEYKIDKSSGIGFWLYDFCDVDNRKIIEFQGDIFHANPKIYESFDNPHPFYKDKSSLDIWESDKFKKEDAEKDGFKVLYVWESEYINDKEGIISECLSFILS